MAYQATTKQSMAFRLGKTVERVLEPVRGALNVLSQVRKELKTAQAQDFGFFTSRPLDPERTRSLFA